MGFRFVSLLFFSFLLDLIYSKVTIVSPKELREKFKDRKIKASYSNFGKIPYGFTITGRVYFNPNSSEQEAACGDKLEGYNIPYQSKVNRAPIVMVNRGSCNFVKKVENVEKIGGHLALIVDNTQEDVERIIMIDDEKRRGETLRIAGVLISAQDGKIIEDFYRENKDRENVLNSIVIEVYFEMEHPSNQVHYSLFFSSENRHIYQTLNELSHYQNHLQKTAFFTPYYIVNKYFEGNGPEENCYSKGQFCMYPRFDLGISDGRQIIKENLRQKCIFNDSKNFKDSYSKASHFNSTYWSYMKYFYEDCIGNTTSTFIKFNDNCAESAMEKSGIYQPSIKKCLFDSFGLDEGSSEDKFTENSNRLLLSDHKVKDDHKIWLIPSLLINNRTFWGSWTGDNIFEALCAAYKTKPKVCYDESDFIQIEEGGLSNGAIITIVIVALLVNVGIFLLCRKYIKNKISQKIEDTDINLKINTVVTSYLALKENK